MKSVSMNKKGESMSLGTIFTIILGLAVVVILIWGFSSNWEFFRSKTSGILGNSNADTIVSACQLACRNAIVGDYCSNPRTLNFGEEKEIEITATSDPKKFTGIGDDRKGKAKQVTGTCQVFANNYTNLGGVTVAKCPTLCVSA